MVLDGLKPLHDEMKKTKMPRFKFDFSYARLDFDVIFMTDTKPFFVLIFGIKKKNKYFEIVVKPGYKIVPYFENETFTLLMDLFDFSGKGSRNFSPKDFFNLFNNRIPSKINARNKVIPRDMARYYSDVEEPDRIYFYGWIDHDYNRRLNPEYRGNVQESNLIKTRKWLGEAAYYRCKEGNISSKWTDIESREDLSKLAKI